MCEFYFLIFLGVIVFSIMGFSIYLNWEVFLLISIFLILYILFFTESDKKEIIENAKEILVGFYKTNDKSHIKTVELYFKNNGTCDILYENIHDYWWYNTKYQEEYQNQESSDILRRNIPYIIKGNKVYLEFDEYNKRSFIIYKYCLTEIRENQKITYIKIKYNESKIYNINRNKRMKGIKRIDFKTESKKKVKPQKIEYEYNEDLEDIIYNEDYSYNETPKVIEKNKTTKVSKEKPNETTKKIKKEEKLSKTKTGTKKTKEGTASKKEQTTQTKRTTQKKNISSKNIKPDKETKNKTKKTESKKNTTSKRIEKNKEVNNKKDTLNKDQKPIETMVKDLDLINAKEKYTSNSYVVEYLNEKNFRQKERGIKKFNMLAYKKLIFEHYPNFREGNFSGEIVSKNDKVKITKYELKLPTDSMFSKVYDDIVLHYTVYENPKIVMLNDITPGDILTESHKKELTTYKGVPISKSHAEKDMFKINLLNMIEK